jgi:hypothetical protein
VATVLTSPAAGTLQLGLDGSLHYLPSEPRVDRDLFSYEATDGLGQSAPASVQILMDDAAPPPDSIFKNSFESTP